MLRGQFPEIQEYYYSGRIKESLPEKKNFIFLKRIKRFIDRTIAEVPVLPDQLLYKELYEYIKTRIPKMPLAMLYELASYLTQEMFHLRRIIEDKKFENFLMDNNMTYYCVSTSKISETYSTSLAELITADVLVFLSGPVLKLTESPEKMIVAVNSIIRDYITAPEESFRISIMRYLNSLNMSQKALLLSAFIAVYTDYHMETLVDDTAICASYFEDDESGF